MALTVKPENPKRFWLLIINLGLVIICFLLLLTGILIYGLKTSSQSQPTLTPLKTYRLTTTATPIWTVTFTPTITRTPRETLTPTGTLTPSITPTPSATPKPTGVPQLPPDRPLVSKDFYRLAEWSPEKAEAMVQMMQSYPDSMAANQDETEASIYYETFQYPIVALKEALLRFPSSVQAKHWDWQLAYDMALFGDPGAGDQYANLIAGGLNRGETDLEYLYYWFQSQEPNLALYIAEVQPPTGFLKGYVLEILSEGGSSFIQLLENSSGFQAFPILTRFDFVNKPQANWILSDLDGDTRNGDELAVYYFTSPDQFTLDSPQVFDISQPSGKLMPFLPAQDIYNIGMEYKNSWTAKRNQAGYDDLIFGTTINPTCPLNLQLMYRWNGKYFSRINQDHKVQPAPDNLNSCELIATQAAAKWGPEASIQIMEELLTDWPPPTDSSGEPYPADARDEWRYRLGVNHALVGNFETALNYFNSIIKTPSVYNSAWIIPSQKFVAAYQKPQVIYTACIDAQFCDPAYAIEYLVSQSPAEKDPLSILWNLGVKTSSSGYFDFDQDGESERWFTVRYHPRDKLHFWILSRYRNGVKALPAAYITTTQPTLDYIEDAFVSDESLVYQPTVILNGSIPISMQRLPEDQKPYLVDVILRKEYPSRFLVPLQAYAESLFSGASPEVIQQNLIDLEKDPGLLCKGTWSCDYYYYLLGLASELANDEKTAIEAYHQLWSDYSKSPLTSMARLKLEQILVPATPIFTPSPSSTSALFTATSTGTIGVTPSPTLTVSPSITIALTPTTGTQTPTVTGTPPTGTPTGTAQISGTPTASATATLSPTSTIEGYPAPATQPLLTPTPYP